MAISAIPTAIINQISLVAKTNPSLDLLALSLGKVPPLPPLEILLPAYLNPPSHLVCLPICCHQLLRLCSPVCHCYTHCTMYYYCISQGLLSCWCFSCAQPRVSVCASATASICPPPRSSIHDPPRVLLPFMIHPGLPFMIHPRYLCASEGFCSCLPRASFWERKIWHCWHKRIHQMGLLSHWQSWGFLSCAQPLSPVIKRRSWLEGALLPPWLSWGLLLTRQVSFTKGFWGDMNRGPGS